MHSNKTQDDIIACLKVKIARSPMIGGSKSGPIGSANQTGPAPHISESQDIPIDRGSMANIKQE